MKNSKKHIMQYNKYNLGPFTITCTFRQNFHK